MFGVEDYSKRGLAERGEFRARPGPNADFNIQYFGVNDKYKNVSLRAPGKSIQAVGKDDDIGLGFRAIATVDYVNTMAFRLTWSPERIRKPSARKRCNRGSSPKTGMLTVSMSPPKDMKTFSPPCWYRRTPS